MNKKTKQAISKSDIKLPRIKTALRIIRKPDEGKKASLTEPKLATVNSQFTLSSHSMKNIKLDPHALKHL